MLNYPLLARGRDRLETDGVPRVQIVITLVPYSLGDAIDWKRLSRFLYIEPIGASPTR